MVPQSPNEIGGGMMPPKGQRANLIGVEGTQGYASKAPPLQSGGRPYGGMLLAALELPPSEVQSKIEKSLRLDGAHLQSRWQN